ncbi:hypothetical protein PPERSA_12438 [Pseudocohnilembus persalinus]|uniref:Calcineurin-like phosphoesterase domain-containing protein n=1 Tax=Pseudocohnilembus persalinus TaxID=266149 RepID=A0A0V0QPE8_PSEPJ|nr:hypothetical protein PPERSA_12438 [Pseudocohnilembus persalinus]|eukprot:KRX03991.1 hypothetical protein PPERSA_12438 [Pseudocohnilembus persalinus]
MIQKKLLTQIKILILSDIHQNYDYISLLQKKQLDNKKNYDYIFILGDNDNIQISQDQTKEEQEKLSSESDLNIEKLFLKIREIYPQEQIYHIPGNHDSYNLFNGKNYDKISNCVNIHKQKVEIAKNLYLLGFGGSIPGYKYNEKTQKYTDQVWVGFPFINDDNYGEELTDFIYNNIENKDETNSDQQIILLTHIGPQFSKTTEFLEEEQPIQSGSNALGFLLNDLPNKINNTSILANIHGHTHDSQGQEKYKFGRVINAGPIQYGQFTEIDLRINEFNKKWEISNVSFNQLP